MMQDFITTYFGNTAWQVFNYVYVWSPLWLPLLLLYTFWNLWMQYIREYYKTNTKKILLEIKLPKEITKSPAAMEVVLTALFQQGNPKNLFETYWQGIVPPWFSLELVSVGGEVKFYIWAFAKYKRLIEHQIYSQYPNVEVHEVPPEKDYTLAVVHDPINTIMWGTYFRKGKPDPYPIKTYVDYNLDQDPKEELKVDPMTAVLEYLGSLKHGEQVWIQLVIRAHRTEGLKEGRLFKKRFWSEAEKSKDPKKPSLSEIDKVLDKERKKLVTPEGHVRFPSKVEGETLAAIERGKSKFPFECVFRGIYYARKEVFDAVNITGLIGSVRQYSTNDLNLLKLGWFTDYDLPWQDFRRKRRNYLEKKMLEDFKKREFYHFNVRTKPVREPMILTTEEIATMFHFPGQVALTPTLPRMPSKKEEAPPNLPT